MIPVSPVIFEIAFLFGTGAVALWFDARFPTLAPADLRRALIRTGIALVGSQGGAFEAFRSTAVATLSAAAVAAAVMALTPLLGASASAALGLVAALAGGALPSQVGLLLQAWPLARAPLVMCWNVLPLSWRAARWLAEGGVGDLAWLTAWLLFGLAAAEWAATRRVEGAAAGASG